MKLENSGDIALIYEALIQARNSASDNLQHVRIYRPYLIKSYEKELLAYSKLLTIFKTELGYSNG